MVTVSSTWLHDSLLPYSLRNFPLSTLFHFFSCEFLDAMWQCCHLEGGIGKDLRAHCSHSLSQGGRRAHSSLKRPCAWTKRRDKHIFLSTFRPFSFSLYHRGPNVSLCVGAAIQWERYINKPNNIREINPDCSLLGILTGFVFRISVEERISHLFSFPYNKNVKFRRKKAVT